MADTLSFVLEAKAQNEELLQRYASDIERIKVSATQAAGPLQSAGAAVSSFGQRSSDVTKVSDAVRSAADGMPRLAEASSSAASAAQRLAAESTAASTTTREIAAAAAQAGAALATASSDARTLATAEGQVASEAAAAAAGMNRIEAEARQLAATEEQATQHAGGLKSALGNISQIAGGFTVANALTQLPGKLMEFAKSAAEDEAATLRVQQAVRNLGGDFEKTMDQMDKAIAAGQRLGFTDDDIRDSFTRLSAATGNADEAFKRQALAMDLARGAGISLESASRLLGKVSDENLQVFRRLGITIKDAATEADVFAAVQQKFGGQAEAFAGSAAGQWESAKIALHELEESIGYTLLPLMVQLAQGTNRAIEAFNIVGGPALGGISDAVTNFGTAADVVDEALERMPSSAQAAAVGLAAIGAALVFVAPELIAVTAGVSAFVAIAAKADAIAEKVAHTLGLETHEIVKNTDAGFKNADAHQAMVAGIDKLKSAGASEAEIIESLRKKHEELVNQYNKINTDSQIQDAMNMSAAINEIEQHARDMHLTFTMAVDDMGHWHTNVVGAIPTTATMSALFADLATRGSTLGQVFTSALGDVSKATSGAGTAAGNLAPLEQKLLDIRTNAEAAARAISDLTNPPSREEIQLTAQISKLKAVMDSLTAATISDGTVKAGWINQTREQIQTSGTLAETQQKLLAILSQFEKGQISGAQAIAQMNAIVKPATDSLDKYVVANQSVRKATNDAADAQLPLGKNLEDIKRLAAEVPAAFGQELPKVPATASQVARDTIKALHVESDFAAAGGADTASFAGAIAGDTTAPAAATTLAGIVKAALRVDMSPEGANAGAGFAAGIGSMLGAVQAAARALAQSAKAAAAAELDAHSYSRWFIKLGENSGGGYVAGSDSTLPEVEASGQRLGAAATSGAQSAISGFAQQIASNVMPTLHDLATQISSNVTPTLHDLATQIAANEEPAQQATHQYNAFGDALHRLREFSEQAAPAVANAGTVVASLLTPARKLAQDIAGLDVEIAKLNVQLAYTEPYSAQANAIQEQIKFLQGWKGQLNAVEQAQAAVAKQQELMKTGGDFFSARMTADLQSTQLGRQFGAGASIIADIGATLKDPAAGAKLADDVNALLGSDAFKKLPNAEALGRRIMELAGQAANGDAGAQSELQGVFSRVFGQAGTLSSQSFFSAFDAALANQDVERQLGSSLAPGFAALRKAWTDGGAENIQAAAKFGLDVQNELQRLPDYLRGTLGTQFQSALHDFVEAPTEDGARAVQEATRQIETAVRLIPESFQRLPAPVQASIRSLVSAAEDGGIGVQDASKKIQAAVGLLPSEFRKLDAEGQASITSLVQAYLDGAVSIEQASDDIAKAVEASSQRAQAAMAAMAGSLHAAFPQGQTSSRKVGGSDTSFDGGVTEEDTPNAFGIPGFTRVVVRNRSGTVISDNGAYIEQMLGYGARADAESQAAGLTNRIKFRDSILSSFIAQQLKATTTANPASPDYDPKYYSPGHPGFYDPVWHGEGMQSQGGSGGAFGTPSWIPQFAEGIYAGPMRYDGLARLHRGEVVLTPKQLAAGVGGMTINVSLDGAQIYGAGGLDEIADQLTDRIGRNLARERETRTMGVG